MHTRDIVVSTMSIEAYEVSYKGNTNERFKNAILDHVMLPAYERTQLYTILSDDPHMFETQAVQQYAENGPMHVYTVYAAKDEPRMDILAAAYFIPDDMTHEEATALQVEILSRHGISEPFKDRLRSMSAAQLISDSDFSYIQEVRYEIDLTDRTLVTTTEFACRINGERFLLNGSGSELDEDRQMVFDADEVVDIVRALHGTYLLDESQVKKFLNADF